MMEFLTIYVFLWLIIILCRVSIEIYRLINSPPEPKHIQVILPNVSKLINNIPKPNTVRVNKDENLINNSTVKHISSLLFNLNFGSSERYFNYFNDYYYGDVNNLINNKIPFAYDSIIIQYHGDMILINYNQSKMEKFELTETDKEHLHLRNIMRII